MAAHKETNKGIETYYAKTRTQWRNWLIKYADKKNEVCLIMYHKKSPVKSISYDEAVEEALCFGWIDSRRNNRDHESYFQRFTPRNPKSNWSLSNINRVSKLIKEGLITEAGMVLIRTAKKAGKWNVKSN